MKNTIFGTSDNSADIPDITALEEYTEDAGIYQMNLFVDYDVLERERRLMGAMLEVRKRYGPNAVFKGMNLLRGATTLERNQQIGGHKA